MFIKRGDGVITDVFKTSDELTKKQKDTAEKIANDTDRDKKIADVNNSGEDN